MRPDYDATLQQRTPVDMNDIAFFCQRALEFAKLHAASGSGWRSGRGSSFESAFDPCRFEAAWTDFLHRLDPLPLLSAPGFAAQMAAQPHPAAVLGYFAAMLFNPNNHDLRHAAATIAMEREVLAEFAAMFGFPVGARGHLTSGGTTANLDGLWSCRQRYRPGAVAFSEDAHFIHARICRLMGVESVVIPCDRRGRIDVDYLEASIRSGRVSTVVLSAGTPGMGAVDPIDEVVALRRRYDFGIHVDASYGGFFALLKDDREPLIPAPAFAAIAECDSVAVDPHKHAFQPYGCGCVLFRDGSEAAFGQESPYTDASPQSGLECSRPGAAAAALWLTLRCLPLSSRDGFGPMLRTCLQTARRLASLIEASERLVLAVPPELGIVNFWSAVMGTDGASIAAASRRLLEAAASEGLFLSTLRIAGRRLGQDHADDETEILRAVLMKPEQVDFIAVMHSAIESLAASAA